MLAVAQHYTADIADGKSVNKDFSGGNRTGKPCALGRNL